MFLQGYSNSIHELIAHSKIFVLSSDYEGLSNSMLESLCIGIPCVCTDCPPGSARMVIDNDQNGILVPVGDSENMALSLKKILDNEEIGKNFNKKNKKYREILLANNICQQWENVIKE